MINGSFRPPVSLQTPRAVINRMKVNMSKVAELMLSSDLLMIVWGVCRETGGRELSSTIVPNFETRIRCLQTSSGHRIGIASTANSQCRAEDLVLATRRSAHGMSAGHQTTPTLLDP